MLSLRPDLLNSIENITIDALEEYTLAYLAVASSASIHLSSYVNRRVDNRTWLSVEVKLASGYGLESGNSAIIVEATTSSDSPTRPS